MAAEKRLIRYEDVYKYAFDGANGGDLEDEDFDAIVNAIEAVPTVDAVEVVHGYWKFKHDPSTDPKRYFTRIVCSECNLHTGQKSNYCPQCGTKMDGDGNG